MSDDPQQEYFSDGISGDIITDLSKVSALSVISRNGSFTYKGKHVDLPKVARELKVSHVLEGSVRKAGGRLRITAQLIDGVTNDHVWAERYDRDLNDIFALQDEISEAIVKALKLKLLPEEKQAIEKRGTDSVEAYNILQMARHIYLSGLIATAHGSESIIRLCQGAIKIDPDYARPWGMLALAITIRAAVTGGSGDEGLAAAERSILLDPSLPEGHAAKGRIHANMRNCKGAWVEIKEALRLEPESYEANMMAGIVSMQNGDFGAAIPYLEKANEIGASRSGTALGLLTACNVYVGKHDRARHYAELTLTHAQDALSREPDNGILMGNAAFSFAVLGQPERVREEISRGLLLDPDNEVMMTSFLRANATLRDTEAAIAMFDLIEKRSPGRAFLHMKFMPNIDFIRDDPRVKAMFAAAEARLAGSG